MVLISMLFTTDLAVPIYLLCFLTEDFGVQEFDLKSYSLTYLSLKIHNFLRAQIYRGFLIKKLSFPNLTDFNETTY